jgi:alanine racemase
LIATVPAGYADGLSRRLSNKMQMLVRGQRAPQVGLVCMDMTLLDVTDVPEVAPEDDVVIIGRQGNQAITAEESAEWSGIPPYEVLCAVSKRVPRIYRP